jgi:polar amino acid transport system substrate-binding protein
MPHPSPRRIRPDIFVAPNHHHHALRRRAILAAAGSLLLPALPAQAQTIVALKSAGVLRAEGQVSQAPWGFMDNAGHNEGFEIELLRAFCAELGITPEFTPVTTSTRIPALLASKIDVIAAVMGIYPDRQKVVLFSRPYCNLDTVFIGKAGQAVKGWPNLKGLVSSPH